VLTSSQRWVAIDFETANREKASACALGLVVIEDGFITEERSWLIQPPGNYFEWRNTEIHGIDEDAVAQEPEFDELWAEIGPYLDGAVILAHNASFDIAVLRGSLDHYELEWPRSEGYYCTVSVARKAWPLLVNHKLDSVCDHCGIALMHHDAASDARACAKIALAAREVAGAESLYALVERLGLTARPLMQTESDGR